MKEGLMKHKRANKEQRRCEQEGRKTNRKAKRKKQEKTKEGNMKEGEG